MYSCIDTSALLDSILETGFEVEGVKFWVPLTCVIVASVALCYQCPRGVHRSFGYQHFLPASKM